MKWSGILLIMLVLFAGCQQTETGRVRATVDTRIRALSPPDENGIQMWRAQWRHQVMPEPAETQFEEARVENIRNAMKRRGFSDYTISNEKYLLRDIGSKNVPFVESIYWVEVRHR